MDQPAPTLSLAAIRETRDMIAPYIVRTPVHDWRGREIEAMLAPGTSVNLKLELFQQSGTFKARGALSKMLRLAPDERARGVTAVSAGNHAIATAYAASCLGLSAKVVMLGSANPARVAACRALGAEVLMAPDGRTAFELVEAISRDEGRAFIHPFEGPYTALGTATLGMEWLEQSPDLDAVIIAIGGGGLCGGASAAIKLLKPECLVFGVEPVGSDTMTRSFAEGKPVDHADVKTIADSLAPPFALPYSYGLCRQNVDDLVLVDDDQIRSAMALLFREVKLAVEPAAAAATAALVGPLKDRLAGKKVGVLVCGSNIDFDSFERHMRQAESSSP
ncbi:MAG: threonine dehydratase [Sphingomonadales bacterium]|jgi:threonine dehydratase|nr:threonine dehydratase [Sphingomonadales bacterium]MEA3043824.1 threonine dehydratase [Sphingomonadales bacterium]MEA3047266.1 threonine dehydratase [Sphingomonadales bacterium]